MPRSTTLPPHPRPRRARLDGLCALAAAFVLLASGCTGYVAGPTPGVPGPEVVRVPFGAPRRVIARREPTEARPVARADTLRGVTAAYGSVLAIRGDTLLLALTQVSRDGTLMRLPRGTVAAVVPQPGRPVERWGYSQGRTTGLALAFGAVIVMAAAVVGIIGEGVLGN